VKLRVVKRLAPSGVLLSPMISYIRRRYSDVLGADIALLDEPGGLEELQKRCLRRCHELSEMKKAA
jgi:hypothetical protein